jgi:hypothetical protein
VFIDGHCNDWAARQSAVHPIAVLIVLARLESEQRPPDNAPSRVDKKGRVDKRFADERC